MKRFVHIIVIVIKIILKSYFCTEVHLAMLVPMKMFMADKMKYLLGNQWFYSVSK